MDRYSIQYVIHLVNLTFRMDLYRVLKAAVDFRRLKGLHETAVRAAAVDWRMLKKYETTDGKVVDN